MSELEQKVNQPSLAEECVPREMTGPAKAERTGKTSREVAMKSTAHASDLESRATEALKALLGQISGVRVKELWHGSPEKGRTFELLAHVDVYGHSHMLACEVKTNGNPRQLRTALHDLQNDAAQLAADATPVLIAPYLSPEAQTLCKENHAGFLDLEGNARLSLGEVFIGKRSHPHQLHALQRSAH